MPEHRSEFAPTPLKCISIILCEKLYRIAGPQNFILVNTFHSFRVSKCPCKFPQFNVLYSVTDGHGTYEMVLDVVHASSGKVVMTGDGGRS